MEIGKTKEKKFDSDEYVIKKYEKFIGAYNKFNSPNFLQMGQTMLSMLNINDNSPIIEVGIGAGHLLIEILSKKSEENELWGVDLTPKMVELCASKVDRVVNSGKFINNFDILKEIHDFDIIKKHELFNCEVTENEDGNITGFNFDQQRVKLLIGSMQEIENLTQKTDYFGYYLSSLCLQIVPDTELALKQSLKILKSGGKAIFTVWGLKETSSLLNLTPKVLKKFGIENTKKRSSWHLGDRKKSIELLKEVGFVNVLGWYQFVPWRRMNFEEMVEFAIPFLEGRTKTDEETLREMGIILAKEYLKVVEEENMPIGINVLFLYGEKE